MKLGLLLLSFTWGFLAVAWLFPGLLRIAGALLFSLADASEAMRRAFQSYRQHDSLRPAQPGLPAETPASGIRPVPQKAAAAADATQNELHKEVIEALVAQGSPKRKAEVLVMRAASQLPSHASFEDLWRKAVAA